jgi:hypothetical protein
MNYFFSIKLSMVTISSIRLTIYYALFVLIDSFHFNMIDIMKLEHYVKNSDNLE